MKIYSYLCFCEPVNAALAEEKVTQYIDQHNLTLTEHFQEHIDPNRKRKPKLIKQLFESVLCAQDHLIVYEPANLGRSTSIVLGLLTRALAQKITIHFVRYGVCFEPDSQMDTQSLLCLCQKMSQQFASRDTLDDQHRKKNATKHVGRPKGTYNKTLKLDQHRSDIMRYLDLKVPKRSIAKLVDCHPQTLQDWINRQKIFEKV